MQIIGKPDPISLPVVQGDRHRFRLEQCAKLVADQVDDRLEFELLGQRLPNLVDDRQLGVALAGFLDRAGAAEGRGDVLSNEGEQCFVLLGVADLLAIALEYHDTQRLSFSLQGNAEPINRRRTHLFDLALPDQLSVHLRCNQHRLAGAEDILGQASP